MTDSKSPPVEFGLASVPVDEVARWLYCDLVPENPGFGLLSLLTDEQREALRASLLDEEINDE
jgi:hypothetical protein